MRTQFVTDNNGNKIGVFFSMKEYEKLVEELDSIEDIKLFDEAKKGKQEFKSAEDVFKEIEEDRANV